MELKIKRLNDRAIIPQYAHHGDAGLDLIATNYEFDRVKGNHIYGTGLAFEIPEGYVGLLFPRSSNRKTNAYLTNHVGVIDSGYRGEVMVTFKNRDANDTSSPYNIGDKLAQLIIVPFAVTTPVECEELSDTERGINGHGSTGN